ncbi:uncharacterized protein LOC123260170 [Cotesia glomerata]|uniref:uncharacterized protein LOC123260170 n=1 Tax=Cotesia glomerata TaxID=32391 RepID=UPI001D0071A3|nr:uncharacterized protein LOC123260170 [Cotesia glomerata]
MTNAHARLTTTHLKRWVKVNIENNSAQFLKLFLKYDIQSLKMATRKITLYDSEREIVVEAIVSEAEAARAERDVFFATELLRKIINQNSEASASVEVDQESSELYDEETSESFIGEERLDSDNPTDLNSETPEFEGETSVYRWNSPCVLLILELYRSMERTLNSGKISQKQVWNKISQDMKKKKGYDVTGPQCHSKIQSLKKTYKSTKDHNNKSGNNRKTWQFYDISTNYSIFS